MELACRQFRAFDLDGLTAELKPGAGWCIVSMIAVGRADDEGDRLRERRPRAELRSAPWI
jgi:hypothetical protein